MFIDMKTKKEDNETVTKGMFPKGIGDLAILINKSFIVMESRMAKQEDLVTLAERVGGPEKEIRGMHGNFDMVFQQLKKIGEEIREADTRVNVVNLQIRVGKLEKR